MEYGQTPRDTASDDSRTAIDQEPTKNRKQRETESVKNHFAGRKE
jgi:hypothetical protein